MLPPTPGLRWRGFSLSFRISLRINVEELSLARSARILWTHPAPSIQHPAPSTGTTNLIPSHLWRFPARLTYIGSRRLARIRHTAYGIRSRVKPPPSSISLSSNLESSRRRVRFSVPPKQRAFSISITLYTYAATRHINQQVDPFLSHIITLQFSDYYSLLLYSNKKEQTYLAYQFILSPTCTLLAATSSSSINSQAYPGYSKHTLPLSYLLDLLLLIRHSPLRAHTKSISSSRLISPTTIHNHSSAGLPILAP